jgi:hypothetical protein
MTMNTHYELALPVGMVPMSREEQTLVIGGIAVLLIVALIVGAAALGALAGAVVYAVTH